MEAGAGEGCQGGSVEGAGWSRGAHYMHASSGSEGRSKLLLRAPRRAGDRGHAGTTEWEKVP